MKVEHKMWVDVPSGYRYGFPRIYDPANDGELSDWIYANGYPRHLEIPYTRFWEYRGEEDER